MQLPDDVLAAMRDERASMMRADALRSLVFALLGGRSGVAVRDRQNQAGRAGGGRWP